jgi:hypothetical protein
MAFFRVDNVFWLAIGIIFPCRRSLRVFLVVTIVLRAGSRAFYIFLFCSIRDLLDENE